MSLSEPVQGPVPVAVPAGSPMTTVARYAVPAAIAISVLVILIGAVLMDVFADTLFNFTQWLYGMPINDAAMSLSETPTAMWVVERFYAIPIMQMIHIAAIAGTFVAVMLLAMQPFGLIGHATRAQVAQRYSRLLWWSLLVVVSSGVAMLFGDTVRNLLNSIFWIKMTLLVAGILTAILYAHRLRLAGEHGEVEARGLKAMGLLLVLFWCLIMVCGRWIAYAPA